MDMGGINLALIEIVGVAALGIILLVMVLRTRSRGKVDNSPADDRATRERYAEAEAERKNHSDSGD
jgi:hypothetical protein